MEFTAEQIAGYLGGEIDGNAGERVSTFSKIIMSIIFMKQRQA